MRVCDSMMAGGGIRLLARQMNRARAVMIPFLVVAVVLAAAPRAEATPIGPNATTPAVGIAAPGGTQLDSVYYAAQGAADLLANVGSAVYRNASGFLDFYYQVTNISPAPTFDEVHRLTGSSFAGTPPWITDVWYVINGSAVPCDKCPTGFFQDGTQIPFNMDRSNSGEGSVVGFNFPLGFEVDSNPSETSVLLLIQTNATVYQPGFVSVINSGTVTKPAFEPNIAVTPEPASLLLFGIGLLGTGAAMRRKRKA